MSYTAHTAAGPPVDYSFKELRSVAEIETEEPRSGPGRPVPQREGEDGGAAGAGETAAAASGPGAATVATGAVTKAVGLQPKQCVIRKITTSVKLNNNMLETVVGLPTALESCMLSPLVNLQWIDLSFNQLTTVEPELLVFENLKALYLHGNCIKAMTAMNKLRKLTKLLSLTLNGNPIESNKCYRPYTIGCLPMLKSLDHSTITEDELGSAIEWYKVHEKRMAERRERMKDMAMESNMD